MAFSVPAMLAGVPTTEGRLELGADTLVWQASESSKRITVPARAIKTAGWYDFTKYCQLWVQEHDAGSGGAAAGGGGASGKGELHRFDGLRVSDFGRLVDHFRDSFGVALAKRSLSARGVNFGGIRISGGQLELVDPSGALIAPLPLSSISAAALPGKGDVDIQLGDVDGDREDEALAEMRLFVPPSAVMPGVRGADGEDGAGAGEDGEGEVAANKAAALHKALLAGAGVRSGAGDPVVVFPDSVGSFLVPRGRFSVELYPTILRLIGSSYDFKIPFKSISRFTYLPMPSTGGGSWADATRYAIVVTLDDPLRQGNQRHPHLVLQLNTGSITVPVNVTEEDRAAGRYEGLDADGKGEVTNDAPKVVGSLFKKISGKPVYKPESFESASRQRAVRCSHKGGQGFLFPLDKTICYIHKPTVLLRYADLEAVEIQRGEGGSSRSFDLQLRVRAGAEAGGARVFTFNALDKSERGPLEAFFRGRGLNVIAPKEERAAAKYAGGGDEEDEDEDDEDDESFQGGDSEDSEDSASEGEEEEEDGGKRKSGKKSKSKGSSGKEKGKKGKKRRGGDSDDE